jgi:RNA ligase (TIGR02306 family)
MQDLANIKQISQIIPHPNADALEIAIIEGWQCVVKKEQFKTNDLVVYIAIDTLLNSKPSWASFLEQRNWRVRLIKLRGELSYGLILPLSVLPENTPIELDSDVSNLLGVVKYQKPESNAGKHSPGKTKLNSFPSFTGMHVTDEVNLQSKLRMLNELLGKPYYITTKWDGSSMTAIYTATPSNPDGEFVLASRNRWLEFSDEATDNWSKAAKKYNLPEILKNSNYGFQCELVAPGIQSNRAGLSEVEIRIFNLFDKTTRKYASLKELQDFCSSTGLPIVTLLESGESFNYSLEQLLQLAKTVKYPNNFPAEGIVLRPQVGFYSETLKDKWSCKVLNSDYLLKFEE